jgi:hypothetical protein
MSRRVHWGLMSRNLMQAAETLKWPLKIIYPNVPAAQRRAFERGYQDLLYLQAEYVLSYLLISQYPSSRLRVMGNSTHQIRGERLHPKTHGDWTKGDGLYPLQALVKGIELRFKYHFQGSRNTNRVDKVCLLLPPCPSLAPSPSSYFCL